MISGVIVTKGQTIGDYRINKNCDLLNASKSLSGTHCSLTISFSIHGHTSCRNKNRIDPFQVNMDQTNQRVVTLGISKMYIKDFKF